MSNPIPKPPTYSERLATAGEIRRLRRKLGPSQEPVSNYWTGYRHIDLYRISDTEPMPELVGGHQTRYTRNRTCARCGATQHNPFPKCEFDQIRYCRECGQLVIQEHERRILAERRQRSCDWAKQLLTQERVALVRFDGVSALRHVVAQTLTGDVLLDLRIRTGARCQMLNPYEMVLWDEAVSIETALERLRVLTGWRLVGMADYPYRLAILAIRTAGHRFLAGRPGPDVNLITDEDCFCVRWADWVGKPRSDTGFQIALLEKYPNMSREDRRGIELAEIRSAIQVMAEYQPE
jgi:hypothetical protein